MQEAFAEANNPFSWVPDLLQLHPQNGSFNDTLQSRCHWSGAIDTKLLSQGMKVRNLKDLAAGEPGTKELH